MLALENATIRRGERTVLVDVSLRVAPGEMVALLGPNGVGKSTILHTLAGELHPTSGRATLDGRPLADYRPAELARRRAMLAQQSRLAFGFRVAEVVALGRSAMPATARENDRAAAIALDRVGLRDFAARDFRQLSGGEQQRVHLARVLAQLHSADREPPARFLLLDEPVANLDPAHQLSVLAVARRMAEDGCGVIMSLHDLNLAAAHADRVLLLADRTVAADGTPEEVLVPEMLERVYGVAMLTLPHPETRRPVLLPAAGRL